MLRSRARSRMVGGVIAAVVVLGAGITLLASASAGAHGSSHRDRYSRHSWRIQGPRGRRYFDNLGIQPGRIKHVWLIILENKSYDASFTGLNNNTYLWQTLPKQGALLKNYFATGHSSQDNYLSLVSGQAPQPDVQDDCTYYNYADGNVDTSGNLFTNPNYGQWTATAGPNAYNGNSSTHTPTRLGCVYPASVPTLFNQFDAAGITWKGYAQDLGVQNSSGGVSSCGAPYTTPQPTSSTTQPNPGSASASGAYVPKHFPFPWFESLLDNSNDCNSSHIEPVLDDPGHDFYSDLQADQSHPNAYPNFVWVTPDNCSDAHDAECVNNGSYYYPATECKDPANTGSTNTGLCSEGGNLSGGWDAPDIPKQPTNGTGGLYAADLFLQHVIPEIESSNEFKDGGLIDITFDEGYPPYTYNNSFYNDGGKYDTLQITPGASAALATDAAGQTLARHHHLTEENSEPTGPNTPLITDPTTGEQLSPGPGDAAGLDKPDNCIPQTPTDSVQPTPYNTTSNTTATCVLGPQAATTATNSLTKSRSDAATGAPGSSTIEDNSIKITDEGRPVSGSGIPPGSYVGIVTDGPSGSCTSPSSCSPTGLNPAAIPIGANGSTSFEEQGYFTLLNSSGQPTTPTGPVTSITLAADCDPTPVYEGGSPSSCSGLTDPYYDANDPTSGGGDTGSVLISPYIKPGTVSDVYYNHYSWLRTIEDLFGVGYSSPGLDGEGHIGYAAQPGLVPFGPDVFTNAPRQRQGW
ncbi:MAG TPA: alkaline phosphatase family protein [Solirubrobacteraceae bacterium]|nr:alkaline phosphatase family protein [Solirubrobacteraceae bacterium]